MMALQGSYYSPNIEDYYISPFDLGYGRSLALDREFPGRDALVSDESHAPLSKVTLVWNPSDVERVFGADHGFLLYYTTDRVQSESRLVGTSRYTTYVEAAGTVHSIAFVDQSHSTTGTQLTVLWGNTLALRQMPITSRISNRSALRLPRLRSPTTHVAATEPTDQRESTWSCRRRIPASQRS
jgi:glycine cleavage system aminomethyltransferase T